MDQHAEIVSFKNPAEVDVATAVAGEPQFHAAYFFYYRKGIDNVYDIAPYEYYDIYHPFDRREIAQKLFLNAAKDERDPPRFSSSHRKMKMERKSYYIVARDDGADFEGEPITFTKIGGRSANYTFKNGEKFSIELILDDRPKKINFACYENHLCKENGEDLEDYAYENFSVQVNFVGGRLRLLEDSGGTNMGGPVPPPSLWLAEHIRREVHKVLQAMYR
ncbi:hypothetical protein [Allosphingosinicella deserti]|uniref:Uncharacterized protein n=1 Tax=Allosphingosinicella deserti TaxID=2116704 RepID=A0A2P7QLR4_9SPHN|nr:hypothetical protein [Sphingomonas deserti]PSJ38895.1 hypothetical protein C7I55_16370 [Sphingomonas deserti]